MKLVSELSDLCALLRRVQTCKELTDSLVLEVLDTCAVKDINKIPHKYVLQDFCSYGAWDQAAIWVFHQCFPGWTLSVEIVGQGGKQRVRILSPHSPPLTSERLHLVPGHAILEAIVHAKTVLARTGISQSV